MKKRKTKLILPRFQLKYAAAFSLIAGLSAMVQTLVLAFALNGIAAVLPMDGQLVRDAIPRALATGVGLTLAVLLPISICVGILLSFRVAGPLYRFQAFLAQTVAGERPPDCRIRESDELKDLCNLMNRATESVRTASEPKRSDAAA